MQTPGSVHHTVGDHLHPAQTSDGLLHRCEVVEHEFRQTRIRERRLVAVAFGIVTGPQVQQVGVQAALIDSIREHSAKAQNTGAAITGPPVAGVAFLHADQTATSNAARA